MRADFAARSGGFGRLMLAASFAVAVPLAGAPGSEPLLPPAHLSAFTATAPGTPRIGLRFYARRDGLVAIARNFQARFGAGRIAFELAGAALTQEFLGARPGLPEAEQRQPGAGNFLMGNNEEDWERGVALYGAVRYRDIYPGIDAVYSAREERLKSDWIVRAGANPALITWNYPDAKALRIQEDGSLEIETVAGAMREDAPVAYQLIDGELRKVEAKFHLTRRKGMPAEVRFVLGAYDRSAELVIDPSLSYSTYIGGTRNESATAIALGAAGSVYIAGFTESTNTPTASSIQNFGGSVDAYVFRFNAGATALLYATFIGGSGDDRAYGLEVDPSGNTYVTGSTTSANFPKVAPLQANLSGVRDAFVLKLNPAGNALIYSSFFGGSGTDIGWAIDVDDFGQCYIAGETTSTNFPTRFPYQAANAGGYDAFTFKLNAAGALVFSTYIGGTANDGARGVAISNNQLTPYLTGYTWSTNFPVISPAQAASGGGQDAFVVRFNGDANGLVYSTYLGGSGGSTDAPEMGMAISVDPFNNVYVAGTTSSLNFPVHLAYQASHGGGGQDAWLRKLSSGGALMFSTYLGGVGVDVATALRVDANRRPYVAGYTSSSNFPRVDATQPALGGSYDAFVTQFESTGVTLVYSTTIGGTGNDFAAGVAADSTNGDTYLAGYTGGTDFPIQAPYRFQSAGVLEIFAAKLTPGTIPPTAPAFLGVSPNTGYGPSATFLVTAADANGANTMDSIQLLVNSQFTGLNSCHLAYVPSTNLFYLLNNTATAWLGGLPAGTNAVIQNGQCSLNVRTATVDKVGNLISLSWPLTFAVGNMGTKFIYMLAVDNTGRRADWASYGIWTSP